MKRIALLIALLSLSASCEEGPKPKQGPEIPTLIGTWQTVHEYIEFTDCADEKHITDVDVSDADAYILTFNEQKTGSGVYSRGGNRYYFDLTWQSEGDKLSVYGAQIVTDYGPDNAIVFWFNWKTPEYNDLNFAQAVGWTVEEFTADKLVLATEMHRLVDGYNGGGSETLVYRLTFTKDRKLRTEDPRNTTIIGSWQAVHQSYNATTDSPDETIKQQFEMTGEVDVEDSDAYRLTFRADGVGSGSVFDHPNNFRYPFDFTWKLVDDRLFISGVNNRYVFATIYDRFTRTVDWTIEEFTADKLIVSSFFTTNRTGTGNDGNLQNVDIELTERYTLERID